MRKRKEEQYHYRSVQTTKKGKTDNMAECVTQAVGSITRFFAKRTPEIRISDANSSGSHPRTVFPPRAKIDIKPPPPGFPPQAEVPPREKTDGSAERPRYTEHPA
eukprot:714423-Heterocapsa_arctica.AAC.1